MFKIKFTIRTIIEILYILYMYGTLPYLTIYVLDNKYCLDQITLWL